MCDSVHMFRSVEEDTLFDWGCYFYFYNFVPVFSWFILSNYDWKQRQSLQKSNTTLQVQHLLPDQFYFSTIFVAENTFFYFCSSVLMLFCYYF